MIEEIELWSQDALIEIGPLVTATTAIAFFIVLVIMLRLGPRRSDERAFTFVVGTLAWLFLWLWRPEIHWPPTDLLLAIAILYGSIWMVTALWSAPTRTNQEDIATTLRRRDS